MRLAVAALSVWLAGCAGVQVHGIATAGAPAYELRGQSLFALDQQAQALCPHGHSVVRQWERQRVAADRSNPADRLWLDATGWLRPAEADQAQLVVQCKA